MFGLTPYNGNGALMATTGFMLAPIASALSNREYSVSREKPILSIAPEQPDSNWGEWLTSGYFGDFLEWAGEQLAGLGSEVFSAPSIAEHRVAMRENRRALKQLFAEALLGGDVAQELTETLSAYLRNGLVLTKSGVLAQNKWKQELIQIEVQAKRVGAERITSVLSEWIAELNVLQQKRMEADASPSQIEKMANADVSTPPLTQYPNPFELSTLNGANGFQINPMSSPLYSVSEAGDVNGDGYSDVIIGAYHASQGSLADVGQSYVIFGSSAFTTPFELLSLNGTNGFQINGIASSDASGFSVSRAGDVNRDGYDDIIIGAPFASRDSQTWIGQSYVIFGKRKFTTPFELSSLNGGNGFQINGVTARDKSGFSVSAAGDVNGDGYNDIIIGAPGASKNSMNACGQSYVVFGKATFASSFELSSLNGANGFQIDGIASSEESGFSVSAAGDMNGDGYSDIIIGAPYASPSEPSRTGQSYVIFGKQSFVSPFELSSLNGVNGFLINGIAQNDQSGTSVDGAGDMNGDGYSDIIIGAPWSSEGGQSYVVFGKATFIRSFELSSLNGENGFQINAASSDSKSGHSVSGAGDINADGYSDIIIGAYGTTYFSSSPYTRAGAGQSYVVFGKSIFSSSLELSSLNGKNGFEINGVNNWDYSGWSVSGAGDMDQDGYSDIVIAAPTTEGSSSPHSYVVYGSIGTTNNHDNKENRKIEWIAGGALVGSLIVGGAACFFYRKRNYNNEKIAKISISTDELAPLQGINH